VETFAFMLTLRFDPLNPHAFGGRPTVQLPDAPPQPLLEPLPGVTKGTLRVRSLRSAILKSDRSVTIYTPPGYDAKGPPCGLLVLFDGHAYKTDIPAPVILDNLLAQGKIPPFVAVLVHQVDRLNELMCSEPFADFLAQDLVPWVRKEYRVSPEPSRTIVGGLSAGGLMAAYCGLRHPEVFGNVLSQSGSFWYTPEAMKMTERPLPYADTGWLTRKFVEAPRLPVRFYLEVGRLEMSFFANQVAENRRLRDVLQAKGYDVTYSEYSGGHDGFCWRGTFARGLLALVAPCAQKNHDSQ
jgi:enterochelin esterase family protein